MVKPNPPTAIQIEGEPAEGGRSTHVRNDVRVSAKLTGTGDSNSRLRLIVRASTQSDRTPFREKVSDWTGNGERAGVTLGWLDPDTRYFVSCISENRQGQREGPTNTDFWTERRPLPPRLIAPPENAIIASNQDVTFNWEHRDADTKPKDPQASARIQWRIPATAVAPAGEWTSIDIDGDQQFRTVSNGRFPKNGDTEWRVRTTDTHGMVGPFSESRSFYVLSTNRAPNPLSPLNNVSVLVDAPVDLVWRYRDPGGAPQTKADVRYRRAGTEAWIEVLGDPDPGVPGGLWFRTLPAGTFLPGVRYEWQVRSYNSLVAPEPSDWSATATFRGILTPGWANQDVVIGPTVPQGCLGSGSYRAFIYDRGGQRLVGEVTPISLLRYSRLRDDISSALLQTAGFGSDCCGMLGSLRTWAHEMVLFRDGERVWEGPITRLAYHADTVEIEARDPMVYVYRRIMRQGYNDNIEQVADDRDRDKLPEWVAAERTVVDRAALIIADVLADDDPNLLPWLTRFDFSNDATESRRIPDWSKTAFEEVDDLAATAGLDYTTVGRRIILHDTHRPVGLIQELRDRDFFDSPVITEYGMSAANVFGVSNNSGLHGEFQVPLAQRYGLGPIEQLASAYGEATTGQSGTMTPAQRNRKERRLNKQAERNLSGRWPPPVVVRIPDNSRLHPEANVGIQQLVPGVHIPLRATTVCREFVQVQKLDQVNVEVVDGTENVRVVMSPAPRGNVDPDDTGGTQG